MLGRQEIYFSRNYGGAGTTHFQLDAQEREETIPAICKSGWSDHCFRIRGAIIVLGFEVV